MGALSKPTWDPPPSCKQALIKKIKIKLAARVLSCRLFIKIKQEHNGTPVDNAVKLVAAEVNFNTNYVKNIEIRC